jgi:hypothetical protein
VEEHPVCEESIREGLGDGVADYLLNTSLDRMPSGPHDYPPDEFEIIN